MGRCPSPIDDPEVEGHGERCVGCPTCRTGELQRLGIQVSQHDYVLAASPDEEVARDFLLFGRPDVTLAVVDATRLERNLNLILQILEITARVVVGLNLIVQARRCGLEIDDRRLARDLGVPVVRMAARYREGLDSLLQAVNDVAPRDDPRRSSMPPSAPIADLPRRRVARTCCGLAPETPLIHPSNIKWLTLIKPNRSASTALVRPPTPPPTHDEPTPADSDAGVSVWRFLCRRAPELPAHLHRLMLSSQKC